jgi:uncharacterized protein (UPF0332 family)
MESDRDVLIKYRIQRSKDTTQEAELALKNKSLHLAQNRIYYAIFYIVSALALKNNFSTSKHYQLFGWFNKNFVNTGLVAKEFGEIYKTAFQYRQKGDYDDLIYFEYDDVEKRYKEMLEFVKVIEKLL